LKLFHRNEQKFQLVFTNKMESWGQLEF